MVLPLHVACYQRNPRDRKWGLAIVTSLKVNVFERDDIRGFPMLFTGGLFQNVLYLAKFRQKCFEQMSKNATM